MRRKIREDGIEMVDVADVVDNDEGMDYEGEFHNGWKSNCMIQPKILRRLKL